MSRADSASLRWLPESPSALDGLPARGEAVALFGLHGERKQWRKGREQAISPQLIERLHRECGIEVIDVPTADQLQIIGD